MPFVTANSGSPWILKAPNLRFSDAVVKLRYVSVISSHGWLHTQIRTCPYLNDIPPHLIHEIKTKRCDVIGVSDSSAKKAQPVPIPLLLSPGCSDIG